MRDQEGKSSRNLQSGSVFILPPLSPPQSLVQVECSNYTQAMQAYNEVTMAGPPSPSLFSSPSPLSLPHSLTSCTHTHTFLPAQALLLERLGSQHSLWNYRQFFVHWDEEVRCSSHSPAGHVRPTWLLPTMQNFIIMHHTLT